MAEDVKALPPRPKQPKQQLTKGMEHMRGYVTIDASSTTPSQRSEGQDQEEPDTYGVPANIQPLRTQPMRPTDNPEKRTDPFQFGTRYLSESDDIFAHNAWDHVEVDSQYIEFIEQQTAFQRENKVSDFDKTRFNSAPEKWWDRFYSNNKANFFKDRKWLMHEFPQLREINKADYGPVIVLEVGAGAGNTAFPLLENNSNPELRLHACDYSKKAIGVICSNEAYDDHILKADVWDAAGAELPSGVEAGTVDLVIMIFIFSALSPDQWAQCLRNIYTLLKPGGEICFRDYGRGDLAQVRFKKGRYLEESFYVRGDGTRVYFFEEQELRDIWSGKSGRKGEGKEGQSSSFEIIDLAVDRRMLVNRQRKLKMYRCWMQGRFRKPTADETPAKGTDRDQRMIAE